MPRLRRKIYLDDICYIDFDINVLRCYNSKGILKNRNIAPDDRIALKFFCENYKDYVHSYNIFKEIKGKPFEEGIDDPQWISGKIYKLREKMRNQKGVDFIQNFGKNNFQLPLKDSPFEDDEEEVKQLKALNEDLKSENEKQNDEIKKLQAALADLKKKTAETTTNRSSFSFTEFLEQAFSATEELGKVFSIDLALSSAWDLVFNDNYMKKFQEAIDKNISFRIIVNAVSTNDITALMQESLSEYLEKFDDPISRNQIEMIVKQKERKYLLEWKRGLYELIKIEKENPNLIKIHFTVIPIMHNMCIIKGDNGNSWIKIRYSTYGNFYADKDPNLLFKRSDDEYKLYHDEFKYLWNLTNEKKTRLYVVSDIIDSIDRYLKDLFFYEEEVVDSNKTFVKPPVY